jgi:hypothetical protein
MTGLRQFVAVELVALVASLAVAGAMACFGYLDSALHTNSVLDPASTAWLGFAYTALFGMPFVAFVGAPIYYVLLKRDLVRWRYVLLAGAAPGLVASLASFSMGFWAILCGIAVASLTHAICRRVGPNNSFKPKPLRGSA